MGLWPYARPGVPEAVGTSHAGAPPVLSRRVQDRSSPGPERRVQGSARRPSCKARAAACAEGLPWPSRLAKALLPMMGRTVRRAPARFWRLLPAMPPRMVAVLALIPSSALVLSVTRDGGLRAREHSEEAVRNRGARRTRERLGWRWLEPELLGSLQLTLSGAAAPERAPREEHLYLTTLPALELFCGAPAPSRIEDRRHPR